MTIAIYDAPELHEALANLADNFIKLKAPPAANGSPRFYIGCCEGDCYNICAVGGNVVSTVCGGHADEPADDWYADKWNRL